jgi:hypothetical protein
MGTVKARLDLAPQGHRAFETLTDLRLSIDEINRLVLAKLDQMEQFLVGRPEFTNFQNWPANAQLATMSMCWAIPLSEPPGACRRRELGRCGRGMRVRSARRNYQHPQRLGP